MRKLVVIDGGDAEELEAKRITVAPHASPGRTAPQGATREVDRLLDLERIPLEVCGLDIERAEGIGQAARGEDRRIDRPGEHPDSIECSLDLRSQLLEHTARSRRVGVEKLIHAIFLKLGLTWETAVHKRVKAVIFYLSGTDAETRSAERSS